MRRWGSPDRAAFGNNTGARNGQAGGDCIRRAEVDLEGSLTYPDTSSYGGSED